MTSEHLSELHKNYREKSLFGRYISNDKIQPALEKVSQFFDVKVIGHSEEKRPIVSIDLGQGKTKILLLFVWVSIMIYWSVSLLMRGQ